jgi:hypothetical protein
MINLSACYFYLGIKIIRDRPRRTLYLSQEAYLYKVLKDYYIGDYVKVSTLIETSSRLVFIEPSYQAEPSFRREY